MKIVFSEQAWEDYQYWVGNDKKILKRINQLIKESIRSPEQGIGKPEKLRYGLSGYSSRRINDEHRMVYRVDNDEICIAQLRYHY
ncbi:MAG: Txe/YoeB family addiction module toxin [Planctomycetes bacterium]|nr:Txe/YoeB family addiction module toxin [Planctomycetota bacterium]